MACYGIENLRIPDFNIRVITDNPLWEPQKPIANIKIHDRPYTTVPAMNFFKSPSNPGAAWHRVGLASAFPDLAEEGDNGRVRLGCKAFSIPKTNDSEQNPVEADLDIPEDLQNQVLVFKYKGKINAVDHVSKPKTTNSRLPYQTN